ncbi:hypothetical protein [Streptomyces spinosirectus]
MLRWLTMLKFRLMLRVLRVLGVVGPRLVLGAVGPSRTLLVVDGRLRRLVLHVFGRHARLRHDVTALTKQTLVDR